MEAPLPARKRRRKHRRTVVVEFALRVVELPPRWLLLEFVEILLLDEFKPRGNRVFDLQVLLLLGGVDGQADDDDIATLDRS